MKTQSTARRASARFLFLMILLGLLPVSLVCAVQVTKQTDSKGRDYFLFTPDKIDPARTYWLVVEVGGFQGAAVGTKANEKSGVSRWANRGDCIGISPSFPNGYQALFENTDEQLENIFRTLQTKYTLHKKLFLYGHSAGAQFSHRFMLEHPELVAGCCSTSAGSWADELPLSASTIPLAISCGEKDTSLSTPMSPMNRIDWARKFAKQLDEQHFFYKAVFWPNAGHGGNSKGNDDLTDEAFSLGTSGMVGKEYANFSQELQTFNQALATHNAAQAKSAFSDLATLLNNAPTANQTLQNLSDNGWKAGPKAVADCMQVRRDFATEETRWLSTSFASNRPLFTNTPPSSPISLPAPSSAIQVSAVLTPQVKPVTIVIAQAALLEAYGPNGNLTAVSPAIVGQRYQCLHIENGKAVLQDTNGTTFEIRADAITPIP